MSIAHELSSDVAAAVLAREKDEPSQDTSELAEVVIKVHSTLRELKAEARRQDRRPRGRADTSSLSNIASAD